MARKIILAVLALLIILIVGAAIYLAVSNGPTETATQSSLTEPVMKHLVTLKTSFGDIQFDTYDDDAPKAVSNFITLANKGFYNNLIFHRVVKGFVIQGGDPNCIDPKAKEPCGAGGPGYKFDDELNPDSPSYQAGYVKGVVAMANSGPNTNGSQFFIMLEDKPLPHNYTIFGKVTKGQDVVDKIGQVETDKGDKPLKDVAMTIVSVEELK